MSIDLRHAAERMENASSEELREQIGETRDEMDRTLDEIGTRVTAVRRMVRVWRGPALAILSLVGLVTIRVLRARRRKADQRIIDELLERNAIRR